MEEDSRALEEHVRRVTYEGEEEADAETPEEVRRYQCERELVAQLREEANELKGCVTRHAFQSIAICSLAMAGILHFMLEQPIVGLGSIGVLVVIHAVCQVCMYKYHAANRLLGYELYLDRTHDAPPELRGRWKPEYRAIGWEEALYAWRFVQSSLFETIYKKTGKVFPNRTRRGYKPSRKFPVWYAQRSLVGCVNGVIWHSGGYLRKILFALHLVACGALVTLAGAAYLVWVRGGVIQLQSGALSPHPVIPLGTGMPPVVVTVVRAWHLWPFWDWLCSLNWETSIVVGATMLVTGYAMGRFFAHRVRCSMLEDGLLSIQSCAAMWQAVVVAHYAALEQARRFRLKPVQLNEIVRGLTGADRSDADTGNAAIHVAKVAHRYKIYPDGAGMPGYSFWLGQEAASLKACAKDIHAWIGTRGNVDVGRSHMG